ncbi:MAG TPA: CopG family transcriptional regulator [Caulobacteraceae bacterium]|nr:CopG family transcriptional regulator [Caulobacteraceae bacterium]
MRTLIDLPDADIKALDALAERRRVSRAKLVREAVGALLAEDAENSVVEAFGLWRDEPVSALEHQRRLRSEW